MARVADVELGWWTELDRWVRPALAAAAVLILAAGVAMFRAHQAEQEIAAESMLSSPAVPVSIGDSVVPRERSGSAYPLPVRPLNAELRMQRSKQQAMMFLLGAVLVGGALGMSADRYIATRVRQTVRAARQVLRRDRAVARSSATRSTRSRSSATVRSAHPRAAEADARLAQEPLQGAARFGIYEIAVGEDRRLSAKKCRPGVKPNRPRSPREHALQTDRTARRAGRSWRAAGDAR